ncbi:MAG: 2-oxo acid dehydrogenase subunit E2 [Bacillaceae bacterium]|nr:2-oxo acid dehydrogenase subunit E2 [Bacillaceae bacterium]
MAYEFKLPDVGEGMAEGEIVRLLVEPGEQIDRDQPILEVQTDKVSVELPSPVGGRVKEIPVQPGDVVPVGSTIMVIETDEAGVTESVQTDSRTEQPASAPGEMKPKSENEQKRESIPRRRRAIAAPATRKLARELGIDIEQVTGTGPAGRIMDQDVRDFAAGKKKEAPVEVLTTQAVASAAEPVVTEVEDDVREEERIDIRGIRKQIAERMVKAAFTIPHVTHFDQVDVTELIDVRKRMKHMAEAQGAKLTYLPFIVKAVTVALKEFPHFNAVVDDENNQMVLKKYYHIGIATDTDDGLLVPVIRHADRKSILDIAREIEDLATRAREKKLAVQELQGSTFTISNVGPIGGMFATPIINHPEVAILATHKIETRPVVISRETKEFDIRDFMNISLSFDHRLIDGVDAVRFTNRIREILEDPLSLMLV